MLLLFEIWKSVVLGFCSAHLHVVSVLLVPVLLGPCIFLRVEMKVFYIFYFQHFQFIAVIIHFVFLGLATVVYAITALLSSLTCMSIPANLAWLAPVCNLVLPLCLKPCYCSIGFWASILCNFRKACSWFCVHHRCLSFFVNWLGAAIVTELWMNFLK